MCLSTLWALVGVSQYLGSQPSGGPTPAGGLWVWPWRGGGGEEVPEGGERGDAVPLQPPAPGYGLRAGP